MRNNTDAGWVKLFRSLLDWRWFYDGNTLKVWIFLLFRANVTPHSFKDITINRGQLATSYRSIAANTHLTYEQARTAIRHLKSTDEITVHKVANFLVISIVNYERYQCSSTDLNTQKTHGEHTQIPRESHQYKKIRSKEDQKERTWENDLNVPEQFLGRFPDAESYLAFMEREG